jgi:hypothetical protein
MKLAPAVLLLLTLPALASGADPDTKEWVPLFNGKDLSGWTPKLTGYAIGENFGNTFRVENGVLKVSYDKYDSFGGRFGHLFYAKPFSHYVIAVEYRFVGEQSKDGPDWAFRNSGVMVHGQPLETMQKDQDFPICIEAQFLGGRGNGTARLHVVAGVFENKRRGKCGPSLVEQMGQNRDQGRHEQQRHAY